MKKLDNKKTIFVTQSNYYSNEMAKIYTGSTQVKNFLQCEAKAMAELNGEWQEDTSDAMLVSSYVDAYFSDELFEFKEEHPEIFTKQGELKAQYKNAEEIIKQIEDDPVFLKYLSGTPQAIMTGEISGVPVKIRIDSYHEGRAIIDLKCIKDFNLLYNEETKQKENFIDFYRIYNTSMFVPRGCETKHRKNFTICNCSCNKGESISEGIIANFSG